MTFDTTQAFSGVINVSRVQNPIELALALQDYPDRVLSDYGAAELAIAWGKTSEVLLAAYHTGEKIGDTIEWSAEVLTGFAE